MRGWRLAKPAGVSTKRLRRRSPAAQGGSASALAAAAVLQQPLNSGQGLGAIQLTREGRGRPPTFGTQIARAADVERPSRHPCPPVDRPPRSMLPHPRARSLRVSNHGCSSRALSARRYIVRVCRRFARSLRRGCNLGLGGTDQEVLSSRSALECC